MRVHHSKPSTRTPKKRPLTERSAEWHSAVSPIDNRRRPLWGMFRSKQCGAAAGCQPAIPQTTSLRYGSAQPPAPATSEFGFNVFNGFRRVVDSGFHGENIFAGHCLAMLPAPPAFLVGGMADVAGAKRSTCFGSKSLWAVLDSFRINRTNRSRCQAHHRPHEPRGNAAAIVGRT